MDRGTRDTPADHQGSPDNPHSTKKPPTIVDVAREADVSVATAARVIGGYGRLVTPALRVRVDEAVERIGYVPNVLARRLRDGNLGMVGLVVGSMVEPYYGEISEAVTEAAEARHSLNAIVSNMQRNPLLELSYCQQFLELRVRGIILSGGGFDQKEHLADFSELVARIIKAGIPVASLSPRNTDVPTFSVDNVEVGRIMAAHLLDHGHEKIAIVLGPSNSYVSELRLQGVMEVLDGAAEASVMHTEYSIENGRRAANEISSRRDGTTGYLVGSDLLAIGAMQGLREAGLHVPRDASVVGIGYTRLSLLTAPTLTSVDTSLTACARAALDYISTGSTSSEGLELQPTIIPGESVASRR